MKMIKYRHRKREVLILIKIKQIGELKIKELKNLPKLKCFMSAIN